jgi:hypothetical protein
VIDRENFREALMASYVLQDPGTDLSEEAMMLLSKYPGNRYQDILKRLVAVHLANVFHGDCEAQQQMDVLHLGVSLNDLLDEERGWKF